eukprot:GHVL01019644.1.p1 GENE.GHVL01019644.1~~GHVL01019644.1.p1  ORF type:complete len:1377 (+),score=439.41 GHVL01019644.1:419-4549(+)
MEMDWMLNQMAIRTDEFFRFSMIPDEDRDLMIKTIFDFFMREEIKQLDKNVINDFHFQDQFPITNKLKTSKMIGFEELSNDWFNNYTSLALSWIQYSETDLKTNVLLNNNNIIFKDERYKYIDLSNMKTDVSLIDELSSLIYLYEPSETVSSMESITGYPDFEINFTYHNLKRYINILKNLKSVNLIEFYILNKSINIALNDTVDYRIYNNKSDMINLDKLIKSEKLRNRLKRETAKIISFTNNLVIENFTKTNLLELNNRIKYAETDEESFTNSQKKLILLLARLVSGNKKLTSDGERLHNAFSALYWYSQSNVRFDRQLQLLLSHIANYNNSVKRLKECDFIENKKIDNIWPPIEHQLNSNDKIERQIDTVYYQSLLESLFNNYIYSEKLKKKLYLILNEKEEHLCLLIKSAKFNDEGGGINTVKCNRRMIEDKLFKKIELSHDKTMRKIIDMMHLFQATDDENDVSDNKISETENEQLQIDLIGGIFPRSNLINAAKDGNYKLLYKLSNDMLINNISDDDILKNIIIYQKNIKKECKNILLCAFNNKNINLIKNRYNKLTDDNQLQKKIISYAIYLISQIQKYCINFPSDILSHITPPPINDFKFEKWLTESVNKTNDEYEELFPETIKYRKREICNERLNSFKSLFRLTDYTSINGQTLWKSEKNWLTLKEIGINNLDIYQFLNIPFTSGNMKVTMSPQGYISDDTVSKTNEEDKFVKNIINIGFKYENLTIDKTVDSETVDRYLSWNNIELKEHLETEFRLAMAEKRLHAVNKKYTCIGNNDWLNKYGRYEQLELAAQLDIERKADREKEENILAPGSFGDIETKIARNFTMENMNTDLKDIIMDPIFCEEDIDLAIETKKHLPLEFGYGTDAIQCAERLINPEKNPRFRTEMDLQLEQDRWYYSFLSIKKLKEEVYSGYSKGLKMMTGKSLTSVPPLLMAPVNITVSDISKYAAQLKIRGDIKKSGKTYLLPLKSNIDILTDFENSGLLKSENNNKKKIMTKKKYLQDKEDTLAWKSDFIDTDLRQKKEFKDLETFRKMERRYVEDCWANQTSVFRKFNIGDIVEGEVVAIRRGQALVSVKDTMEDCIVPQNEFVSTEAIEKRKYTFQVKSVKNDRIVISRQGAEHRVIVDKYIMEQTFDFKTNHKAKVLAVHRNSVVSCLLPNNIVALCSTNFLRRKIEVGDILPVRVTIIRPNGLIFGAITMDPRVFFGEGDIVEAKVMNENTDSEHYFCLIMQDYTAKLPYNSITRSISVPSFVKFFTRGDTIKAKITGMTDLWKDTISISTAALERVPGEIIIDRFGTFRRAKLTIKDTVSAFKRPEKLRKIINSEMAYEANKYLKSLNIFKEDEKKKNNKKNEIEKKKKKKKIFR